MIFLTPRDSPMELDATGASVTEAVPIGEAAVGTVQARAKAGAAWSNAVLSVRVSNNGEDFDDFATAVTLSEDGTTDILDLSGWAFLRIEVTTADGSAPVIDTWVCLK